MQVSDLGCTLLIGAHTFVRARIGEEAPTEYSLLMSIAVGDGMIAVIDRKGQAHLQMTPDSGEFSGETEFLTDKMVKPESLRSRTRPFLGRLQAILAMTDGVADDYFPPGKGMSRLFGDLVVNGILDFQAEAAGPEGAPDSGTEFVPSGREYGKLHERLLAAPAPPLTIRSVEDFATRNKRELEQVLAEPALLAAGARGASLAAGRPVEERLLAWLDTYQVRGSFDDRTLVVLQRKGAER